MTRVLVKDDHSRQRYPPTGIHRLRSDMVARATMWKRVPFMMTGFTSGSHSGTGVSAGITASNEGRARLR